MSNYSDFLSHKKPKTQAQGFDVDPNSLASGLFGWQREAVSWALGQGRCALFEECGLGKTRQELSWGDAVAAHTGTPTLLFAPLAVGPQTKAEGERIGIPVTICRDQSDVRPGVNITNYERLEKFDLSRVGGVGLDESSILKSFSGSTKRALVEACSIVPFRLAATATPSPNDTMELGNTSEFLGVMRSNEMLARWFINDTTQFGTYRLKKYAEADYWEWVASWAMCLSKPSDLTGNACDDAGYDLPELVEEVHILEVDTTTDTQGRLFRLGQMSATGMHKEKRITLPARLARAASIANSTSEPVIVWCETNDESAALKALIPDAVEVKGSDSPELKEARLLAFSEGRARVIITKPSIAGWGLNWQHCNIVIFASLTFSFESYYQALRRAWRFGQLRPVHVHLILAQTEMAFLDVLRDKGESHTRMQAQMAAAMRRVSRGRRAPLQLIESNGLAPVALPAFLKAA